MKVVIGTRRWLGADWTHVDADPAHLRGEDGLLRPVDVVCDARAVRLPDGCAEEVYSQECLEHFPWKDTPAVVAEWCRLVAPGGIIRVEVPDFLAAAGQLVAGTTAEEDYAMNQIFFGGQDGPYDIHYAGITHRMLEKWFVERGFEVVNVERGWECGWLRVEARRRP